MPALLLFLGLVIAGARIAMASDAVHTAAGAAARAASLERTASDAQRVASSVAQVDLSQAPCQTTSVTISTGGFAAAPGAPATVTATVSCTVSFTDVLIPMPGSKTLTESSTSAIDRFRERR